jgi:hypothetical protein
MAIQTMVTEWQKLWYSQMNEWCSTPNYSIVITTASIESVKIKAELLLCFSITPLKRKRAFLTSSLDWGEWSTSRTRSFACGERDLSIHWLGDWLNLRVQQTVWSRETSFLPPRIEPCFADHPAHGLVAVLRRETPAPVRSLKAFNHRYVLIIRLNEESIERWMPDAWKV